MKSTLSPRTHVSIPIIKMMTGEWLTRGSVIQGKRETVGLNPGAAGAVPNIRWD